MVHEDLAAVRKLRRNEPMTPFVLAELEQVLVASGVGTADDIAKAKEESRGLGLFLRSLVGIDREVAKGTLRILGIDCSMSRTGCCYDNAVAERFFWSLKHEWTKHLQLIDLEPARLSVFQYIETFYNPVGIHQTLDYLSPNQYEAVHAPAQAA